MKKRGSKKTDQRGRHGRMPALGHPRVIKVGRKQFVLGLFWQTTDSAKNLASQAKRAAANPKIAADLYVARVGGDGGEYALARSSEGVPRNAIAAASVVAAVVPEESWSGVFRIADGYWFLAVREGLVLPEGDVFFAEEDAAKARLQSDVTSGSAERILAPEDWSLPDADTLDIEATLDAAKGPVLKSTSVLRQNLAAILASALLITVAGTGYYFYDTWQDQQAKQRDLALERQKLDRMINKKTKQSPPRLWASRPSADAYMAACLQTIADLPAFVPGYVRSEAVCSSGGVQQSYAPDAISNVAWLEDWAATRPDWELNFTDGNKGTTLSRSLEGLSAREADPELRPRERSMLDIRSISQSLTSDVRFARVARWTPPAGKAAEYERADFGSAPFEITTKLPAMWGNKLAEIPGVTLDRVTFEEKSDTYTIRGTLHVSM